MNVSNTISKIDPQLKIKATQVLNDLGLSLDDFIQISLNQIINNQEAQLELKLMAQDKKEHYTFVKDIDHLKKIINYSKDV